MLNNLTKAGKIGLCIFLAGVKFFVIGFCMPHWVASDNEVAGLWKGCVFKNDWIYCASTLSKDFRIYLGGNIPGWFRGTQACACFALLCIIADVVCKILLIVWNLKRFLLISIILDKAAAALAFLGAAVFGNGIKEYRSCWLDWGFAFDIIGGILLVGSAVCFFIEYRIECQANGIVPGERKC